MVQKKKSDEQDVLVVRDEKTGEISVYYVQYAHARICTLLKALAAEGYTVPAAGDVDLSVLTDATEKALIKELAHYSVVVVVLPFVPVTPIMVSRSAG